MASSSTIDDDIMASLGDALMRDILASPSSNGNSAHTGSLKKKTEEEDFFPLHLASLEAELDLVMNGNETNSKPPSAVPGALIMNHYNELQSQQQQQQEQVSLDSILSPSYTGSTKQPTLDLWNTTSMSKLEEEFLAADKKKKEAAAVTQKTKKWDHVQDYDASVPPPGLTAPPPGLPRVASVSLSTTTSQKSQQTTLSAPPGLAVVASVQTATSSQPPAQPTLTTPPPGLATIVSLPQQMSTAHQPHQPLISNAIPVLKPGPPILPAQPPPGHGILLHPHPLPPPTPIYNNPNIAQPSKLIPLKSISSSLMSSRDISYILFHILRSLADHDDYYFEKYHRLSSSTTMNDQISKNEKFQAAIVQKSKEWKVEKHILGKTHKTDVKRPKPLIEIQKKDFQKSSVREDEERQTLWNYRIFVDECFYASEKMPLQEFQHKYFISNPLWKDCCFKFDKGKKMLCILLERQLFPQQCTLQLILLLLKYSTPMNVVKQVDERLCSICQFHLIHYWNSLDLYQGFVVEFTKEGEVLKQWKDAVKVGNLFQGFWHFFVRKGKETYLSSDWTLLEKYF